MPDEKIKLERAPSRRKTRWLARFVVATFVCLAAAIGLGYYGWTVRAERNASEAELRSNKSRTAACNAQLASLTATSKDTQGKLDACTKVRTALDEKERTSATSIAAISRDLNATKAELELLRKQRAETAKRLAAFKDITAKFRRMIDSGKLDVEVRNGRMVVKLPAGVLFPSGRADLSREGELALMEVAVILRGFPRRRFMIVGHTDNRALEASTKSKYKDNWDLSTARAVRVTRFMMEAKLKPQNLLAAGHAQYDPVSANTTSKGRQNNRRIEIVLLPNIEELPSSTEVKAPPAK